MKRPRKRNNENKLSFQKLEARQLLAGDLIGAHQAAGSLPTGVNVVVNGDFESFTAGSDNFFDQSEVPAWNAVDSATGQEINIMPWNVAGYDRVLDIDSTTTDFDRVYQDVPTEAETEYLVAFDYRNHPTVDLNATDFTHDFEVWWNNSLVGRFTGGDSWTTGVIKVTSSNLDATRLLFCEIQESGAAGGDGRGALLDNIRVFKASEVSIENGSFETTTGTGPVFDQADVAGWSAMAADAADRLVRVQTDSPSEGTNYLNLDTNSTSRDIVFTNLATEAGSGYYVTFDMRVEGDQATSPDELRVRWNGEWATTINGTSDWETYGLFLTADSDSTRLTFLEPGDVTGDGSGPMIDNVKVYEVGASTGTAALAIDANGGDSGTTGSADFIPGIGAQAVGQQITLAHTGSGNLDSVVVTLDGVANGQNELLSISTASIPVEGGNPKIALTKYDAASRQMTLAGTATAAEYQAVLRTLTYFNAASNVAGANRTATIQINDSTLAGGTSAQANIVMNIETNQSTIDDAILDKFIVDNSLTTTDLGNGLHLVLDTPGTGLNPTINSTVRAKYNGKFVTINDQNKLVEGESFDFSSEAGTPFPLSNVIQGWQIGIPEFKVGGIGQLLIPSRLAYGTAGRGAIPGNAVLVFDIELLEIIS